MRACKKNDVKVSYDVSVYFLGGVTRGRPRALPQIVLYARLFFVLKNVGELLFIYFLRPLAVFMQDF